ncbi:integrin-linked protein kinase 1-like isoform X1 [Salvia splendens]|uniref:integrin-linked protein kinase 1-like isoform X1 n=1 Tax=Salvia splendens TaxID=180675 RepID=UPI001C272050|nr:integrin-linked protein kinase 1-like isoform X1 [Salvia splendens]
MDSKLQRRFTTGRPSSGAPENDAVLASGSIEDAMDSGVRLMYLANEGDLEGIQELLDSGTAVNFRDIDNRSALHVAACQGRTNVVDLLLRRGAEVDVEDRWGSTPLADAIYYKNNDIIKLLEANGAKPPMAPMHVENDREVPEYEIDPNELDFTNSVEITKGTFCIASWRGIQVAVKKFAEEFFIDEEKVNAFRDELALLQKIRHPNVVQFLGAVTQCTPMMIVTEYLPKGDLCAYLKRRHALKLKTTIKFALDIARGMNYLHENKPEAIIHRDLEPSNILRDDSGHLKVADFGLSKLMKVAKTVKEDKPVTWQLTSWRYAAPEVFRNEEYDTKVDVFSFALILQEMVEGHPPFTKRNDIEVAKAYAANERPPFEAPVKHYAYGLRRLIEDCWHNQPSKRPTFGEIIVKLDATNKTLVKKRRWKLCLWYLLQRKALNILRKFESVLKFNHSSASSSRSAPSVSTVR